MEKSVQTSNSHIPQGLPNDWPAQQRLTAMPHRTVVPELPNIASRLQKVEKEMAHLTTFVKTLNDRLTSIEKAMQKCK